MRYLSLSLILFLLVACTNNSTSISSNNGDEIFVQTLRGGFTNFLNRNPTYVVSTDGSGEVFRSLSEELGDNPEWSPNGIWIVSIVWHTHQSSDIYLIRSGSNHKIKLTNDLAYNYEPAWSPDSKCIAYYSTYDGESSSIYILDIECLLQNEKCNPTPRFLAHGQQPDWSPDGKQIVYLAHYGPSQFSIINSDGSGDIVTLPTNTQFNLDPRWSPDGKRIVFTCRLYDICLMNVDGSGIVNLTREKGGGSNPRWSPDGSRITFVSRNAERGLGIAVSCSGGLFPNCNYSDALFLMNADGSNLIRLSKRNDEKVIWHTGLRNINNHK